MNELEMQIAALQEDHELQLLEQDRHRNALESELEEVQVGSHRSN
jgi:hypothetical protein